MFLFMVLLSSNACADDNAGNNQMENTKAAITVNGK